jgi:DNA-binding Lrp family transcriptional regulator
MTVRLDSKDRLLLELLVGNARMTNRELARRVGLSPSGCLARVRRLESEGVIVGYRAVIAPRGAGRRVEGWASVRLVDADRETTSRFLSLLGSTPEIVEAHRVAGDGEYALRICAGDFDVWNEFRKRIDGLACNAQARFNVLLEALK